MMIWVWIVAVPFLLGKGMLAVAYRKKPTDSQWPEAFLTGICMEIGLTEAAHLTAVFFGFSLKTVIAVWLCMTSASCLIALIILLAARRSTRLKKRGHGSSMDKAVSRDMGKTPLTAMQQLLLIAFVLSVLLQVVIIWNRIKTDWTGDITLETVQSFLTEGEVYGVNPLTGRHYELGLPARLKILSLPTLYAALCQLSGMAPSVVVCSVVPVVVLLAAYSAYYLLGKLLFYGERTRMYLFLLVVNIIFWFGDYMEEMDGFQLMRGGYRGTALRAGILIPLTIYSCLRKSWWQAVLCILTEACIVWTLYGMGACLLITLCMAMLQLCRPLAKRWEGRKWGNS